MFILQSMNIQFMKGNIPNYCTTMCRGDIAVDFVCPHFWLSTHPNACPLLVKVLEWDYLLNYAWVFFY